jgi:hypothetical protein
MFQIHHFTLFVHGLAIKGERELTTDRDENKLHLEGIGESETFLAILGSLLFIKFFSLIDYSMA